MTSTDTEKDRSGSHGIMRIALPLLFPSLFLLLTASATADGTVQLQLVGNTRGSALIFQQWAQELSKAGIKNVRIRSGNDSDLVGVVNRGTKESPYYLVTGLVKSADELILPGGTYRRRDLPRLAKWLDNLARHGPDGPPSAEAKSAFGLSGEQFAKVQTDLAKPITFPTKGMTRDRVVETIRRQLAFPLAIDRGLTAGLAEDRVAEDLTGLACGTSLACVLRPMGLSLVPRVGSQGPEYTVVAAKPGMTIWPIGIEPKKRGIEIAPKFYELHSINIENVSASAAMEAIAKQAGVALLIDHNALARHGIDPTKIVVSHPRARTSYYAAMRRVVYQAKLKCELRVDESGKPLLWITTIKPM